MGTRESFVQHFGEDNAKAVEAAAAQHANGINDVNKGSDLFRWAICICLGYECMSKDSYRNEHGITAPWPEIDKWIMDHGNLKDHNGDVDYIALFAGTYRKYVGLEESK